MINAIFKNIQILSAIIWAATILISSSMIDNSNVQTLLITAAGLHVVLLSHVVKRKGECKLK